VSKKVDEALMYRAVENFCSFRRLLEAAIRHAKECGEALNEVMDVIAPKTSQASKWAAFCTEKLPMDCDMADRLLDFALLPEVKSDDFLPGKERRIALLMELFEYLLPEQDEDEDDDADSPDST